MKPSLLLPLLVAILAVGSGASAASAYTISVRAGSSLYYGATTATISGQVSPSPGPGTAALIRVFNPSGVLVTASQANVNGTTGLYSTSFVLGGSSSWVSGTYFVNATWGAYGSAIFSITTFIWSSSAATTSSTTVTTTSATTTTQSTTTTTSRSTTTSSTTSQPTTSSSTTSATQTTLSASTSSSAGGGGGIPEFPFEAAGVLAVAALVAVSYVLVRRQARTKVQP